MTKLRDHGGGLDAAAAKWGGTRCDWLDLSTGINPAPYPTGKVSAESWTALPDQAAFERLTNAVRTFWNVPEGVAVLPAPGASALIAQLPHVLDGQSVEICKPTYNEHEAAFVAQGWDLRDGGDVGVFVHPNNPDGRMWTATEMTNRIRVIDESFCDIAPDQSHIQQTVKPETIVLKSFGKFWGLAGLRLGFVIGDPEIITRLRATLGPWQVSGPALSIGTTALEDDSWAEATRVRLSQDATQLDALMTKAGAKTVGGTTLFRLYDTSNAQEWQNRLAEHHIWSRIFPYSKTWLRLGLPGLKDWARLEAAL